MILRWKLIITELILASLMELAPASLNTLQVVAQYVTDLSQRHAEACITYCDVNSYIQAFGSETFKAPTLSTQIA